MYQAPDYPLTPSHPEPRWRPYALAAVVGGLVALLVGGIALATGVVDGHSTKVIERQAAPTAAAAPGGGHAGVLDARQLYSKDAPGVAFIESSGIVTKTPFGQERGVATGSGFVVDKKGDILTNAHVVAGAHKVTARFGGSGSELPAKVVGTDRSNDLAVLRVDPSKAPLTPLSLGDSDAVHVGDSVVAIGNPFGYDRTITAGIVSALQRHITAPDGFTIDHVIQTDAAINPGNSGGPLIDAHGRVIGINSQIATGDNGGNGNVGIGFAVPIDTAKQELQALERGGAVKHAFLGVESVGLDASLARAMHLPAGQAGALVERVDRGSPAARAGLRGGHVSTRAGVILGGDVIESVDGRTIQDPDTLAVAIAAHKPGEAVAIGYIRSGVHHAVKVTLGARPARFGG